MNFELSKRSKKVKSTTINQSQLSQEYLMNYLFELKTKLDYFYHMFSVMHTKEVIKECEEDTDDEESRSEQWDRRIMPSTSCNSTNCSKKKEEIPLTFNTSESNNCNPLFISSSQVNQTKFPLLVSKKNMMNHKDNESKSKASRNMNYSSTQNLNAFMNNTITVSSNPFMNNTFGGQTQTMNLTDGPDVNMF